MQAENKQLKGPESSNLGELSKELGLEDKVKFHDFVPFIKEKRFTQ
jgi:hypothetical protein